MHLYPCQRVGLVVAENEYLSIAQHLANGGICCAEGVADRRRLGLQLEGSTYCNRACRHGECVVRNRNVVVCSVFYGKYIEFVACVGCNSQRNRLACNGFRLIGGNTAVFGWGNRYGVLLIILYKTD